jgi:hypothetical protein
MKFMTNTPASAKKSKDVRSLIVGAFFRRKKANCSEVTPQYASPKMVSKGMINIRL